MINIIGKEFMTIFKGAIVLVALGIALLLFSVGLLIFSKATKDLLLSFGVSPQQVGPGGTIVDGAGGRMGNLADVAINNPNFGYSAESRALGLALGFTPVYGVKDIINQLFDNANKYGNYEDDKYYNIKVFKNLGK